MKFFKKLETKKIYTFLKYCFLFIITAFLLGNIILKVDKIFAFTLENPTIFNVEKIQNNCNQFHINGITEKGTSLFVYVDGTYEGDATIKKNGNDKFNTFEYYSQNSLTKGEHEIKIISKNNILSAMSAPVNYTITMYQDPTCTETKSQNNSSKIPPRPEIAKPINNQNFERNWVIVSGLTNNNTKIHIYLDEKYIASTNFLVDNSGTASFSYKLTSLTKGTHKISIKAESKNGFLSDNSEIISFNISSVKNNKVVKIKNNKTKNIHTTYIQNIKIAPTQNQNTNNIDNVKTPSIINRPIIEKPQNNEVIHGELIISGNAKNSSSVKILIDNILVHTIDNGNVISKFTYIHKDKLENGLHSLHIETYNNNHKVKSEYTNFVIAEQIKTQIGDLTKVKKSTTTKSNNTTNQSNNIINIVIFSLFLLSIILWIILINKDIIVEKLKKKKTKQEQVSEDSIYKDIKNIKKDSTTEDSEKQ